MNINKYKERLKQKKIDNLKPFKVNSLYIDNLNLNLKIIHLKTISNLNEYVINLFMIESNIGYLVKNIFYLDLKMKYLDVDIIVFNNEMKIINLLSTNNKCALINSLNQPINILILAKNVINYFDIQLDQKINFSYW